MRARPLSPLAAALVLAAGAGCNQIIDLEPGLPQTSAPAAGTPVQSFTTDSTAGVIDDDQGRSWQRTPTPPPEGHTGWTWSDAVNVCDKFADSIQKTGFHVPARCELLSVTVMGQSPAINSAFMHVALDPYWTSSCYGPDPNDKAWVVDFKDGAVVGQDKSSLARVLCVNRGTASAPCEGCP